MLVDLSVAERALRDRLRTAPLDEEAVNTLVDLLTDAGREQEIEAVRRNLQIERLHARLDGEEGFDGGWELRGQLADLLREAGMDAEAECQLWMIAQRCRPFAPHSLRPAALWIDGSRVSVRSFSHLPGRVWEALDRRELSHYGTNPDTGWWPNRRAAERALLHALQAPGIVT